jgi:hybrid cluster-associated redox disulfide protein
MFRVKLGRMSDKIQITLDWTVEQTLQDRPEISRVYIKNRTKCVGCWLEKFCTIKDVAETYHLDANKLLQDLNQSTIEYPAR